MVGEYPGRICVVNSLIAETNSSVGNRVAAGIAAMCHRRGGEGECEENCL
jgi:hypothetical protein